MLNPYKVLNIDASASKKDIIQGVALAMQTRKYSGKEIAIAQKELLNPVTKAVNDFIYFIDPIASVILPKIPEVSKSTNVKISDLKLLPVFEEE